MTFTLDANILLYASDDASPLREQAEQVVRRMAEGPEIAYLFWPTVMAYLRLASHPAVFAQPLPVSAAMANIGGLLARPHIRSTGEQDRFWDIYRNVADDAVPSGNLLPDAHIVSLMIENGVRTIWTRDRDFRRFQRIEVIDPFADVS